MNLLQNIWSFLAIQNPDSFAGFLITHDMDYRRFWDDLGQYLRHIGGKA